MIPGLFGLLSDRFLLASQEPIPSQVPKSVGSQYIIIMINARNTLGTRNLVSSQLASQESLSQDSQCKEACNNGFYKKIHSKSLVIPRNPSQEFLIRFYYFITEGPSVVKKHSPVVLILFLLYVYQLANSYRSSQVVVPTDLCHILSADFG